MSNWLLFILSFMSVLVVVYLIWSPDSIFFKKDK